MGKILPINKVQNDRRQKQRKIGYAPPCHYTAEGAGVAESSLSTTVRAVMPDALASGVSSSLWVMVAG